MAKRRIIDKQGFSYTVTNNYKLTEGWYYNTISEVNGPVFVNKNSINVLKELYGPNPSHLEKILDTDNSKIYLALDKYKDEQIEESDLVINEKGQLCETLELGDAVFTHVFNTIKEDPWVGLSFSFHPKYISKKIGW